MRHEDDIPWLREEIDDPELKPLFSGDTEAVQRAVRHLIRRAREDLSVEERLIEILDTAIAEQRDDTEGSLWAAVILSEIGSERAIGSFLRGLACESDELLQDVSGVGILRIGRPAVLALMERLEEADSLEFRSAAYRVLGDVGILGDDYLTERVRDFLVERVPYERRKPPAECAMIFLAEAGARLGCRDLIAPLQRCLREDYQGHNPLLEDAILTIEENQRGIPIVPAVAPWEERYPWLYADERDAARVSRGYPTSGDEEEEAELAFFFWGLSGLGMGEGFEDEFDARRFLDAPPEEGEDSC